MKIVTLAALACAGFAATPLFAQPAAAPTPPSTRAEMEGSIAQRFGTRDANHDGFLTSDELGESAPMALGHLDTDHDGKISLAEARTAMLAMFDAADTNHDGTISPEERAAASGGMGAPPPQPAPQGN